MKLNRDRVVICLETQIHIYELASMKCLQILSTAPNPTGLMALSGESSSYLVFPSGVAGAGSVVLYDCISLRLLSQIDAHKKTLMAMQFNRYVHSMNNSYKYCRHNIQYNLHDLISMCYYASMP